MIPGLKSKKDSFTELLANNQDIYVINNSEPRAIIICTYETLSGKSDKLEFPRTWIPFCLTDMLPREVLSQSIDIRKFIAKGLLKIIPEEDALRTLQSKEGMEEYDRLMASEYVRGSKMTVRKQEIIDAEREANRQLSFSGANPNVQYNEINLHPKMKAWEMRSMVGELSGSALVSEFRIHANEFTKDDVQFLLTAQFPQEVKDYASEAIKNGSFRERPVTVGGANADSGANAYNSDWDVG